MRSTRITASQRAAMGQGTKLKLSLRTSPAETGKSASICLFVIRPMCGIITFRTMKSSVATSHLSGLRHEDGRACGPLLSFPWALPCVASEGAISGWLIPSEFMDVNYGQAVKRYLFERVTSCIFTASTQVTCSLPTRSFLPPSCGFAMSRQPPQRKIHIRRNSRNPYCREDGFGQRPRTGKKMDTLSGLSCAA